MKTIQKISALLVVSASLSMAGVIDIYTDDGKKPSTSLNLTTIDSLTFSGKAEKKELDFSGKAKQKAIKLSKIDRIKFSLKDKSKETMTVKVSEGVTAGKYTFKLSEIKKIEIVEMDANEDTDGDGLADLDEIYKYDTNPKAADTDGDGWSDSEELADGMYSPSNPTKFNPRIADVPGLRVTLKKSPSITLNITTSEGKTESESVTEGREVTNTNSMSYEQTRSSEIMHGWEFSTTHNFEWSWEPDKAKPGFKYSFDIHAGYNGSYTSSTGMTWGSSEEKSVAESYEKAITKEKSEGSEVSGAKLCMQVELKNTADIAFTIEEFKLSASTFDIKDTSTLKILADLDREGGWSKTTLKPGEAVEANFCNENVAVEKIENLIYNTSSIVLGSASQTITFGKDNDDFTEAYTKVAAKTADITIDYGPGSAGNPSARYQVATNYRYNLDHKGSDDMYAKTSLAELLRIAHVDFKQDSVVGPSKKKLYGLASIEGFKFSLADSAMWYITIQRAKDIKKGINTMDLYTFAHSTYDMEEIFVGAGDAVHIFYSKDQDHDGVPLPTEHLFGTSDKKVDSDGDGLSDYDEITGWTKGKSKTKIYTDPTNEDTDGDGLNDKKDPEPTRRAMFEDASLSMLQVFSDSTMAESSRQLNKDSAALADADSFNVFVQAPSAFFKVVPNAKKVAWVKFITDETMRYVEPTEEDGKRVYSFQTPGQLSILDTTRVKIEVKSEDEANTKTYTLSITSALIPPTNLKLGKRADRTAIIVIFERSADPRVEGYAILRGNKNTNLPDRIEDNAKITNNSFYGDFNSFLVGSDENSYTDEVGGGSPYYVYRVYAFTKKKGEDFMIFSKGTEMHGRSVGRIKVDVKLKDFGGEYYYYASGRNYIKARVTLHDGKNSMAPIIREWNMYDWEAGKSAHGETVIFLSEEFDEGHDVKPDPTMWSGIIGSDGMYLYFYVLSKSDDDDTYSYSDEVRESIYWEYKDMAKFLKAEDGEPGIDSIGDTPKKGDIKYLVGKGGIGIDTPNDDCGCGEEPHTGYIFWFDYYWHYDEDFY